MGLKGFGEQRMKTMNMMVRRRQDKKNGGSFTCLGMIIISLCFCYSLMYFYLEKKIKKMKKKRRIFFFLFFTFLFYFSA